MKTTSARVFRATGLLAVALVGACGAQSPLDSTGRASEPIVNGLPDTGDPAVVLFDDGNYYCTGVLVSPHVVLTAGHCTSSMTSATNKIYFGPDRASATAIAASTVFTDPMYPADGHDQGVVILTSAGLATPVPLNRTTLTMAMAGQPVRVVGWGRPSVNGRGGHAKLQGTDTWDMFTDAMIHFGPGPQHECKGDSGGPALQTIGGCEVIIGIVSFHDDNACMSGWYNRVDDQLPFIDQYIQMYDPGYVSPCGGDASAGSSSGGSGSGSTSGGGGSSGSSSGSGASSSGGSSNGGTGSSSGGASSTSSSSGVGFSAPSSGSSSGPPSVGARASTRAEARAAVAAAPWPEPQAASHASGSACSGSASSRARWRGAAATPRPLPYQEGASRPLWRVEARAQKPAREAAARPRRSLPASTRECGSTRDEARNRMSAASLRRPV